MSSDWFQAEGGVFRACCRDALRSAAKPTPRLGLLLLTHAHRSQGNTSVEDPDPGSGAFLTPGSGMCKKSGSGMKNPDHISESLETIFLV
jgi:hypothetical protein